MQTGIKAQMSSILTELSGMEQLQTVSGFQEEFLRIQERLSDDEFRIAVVGEFSSGKSTFINAILGEDVLPHATTETTATLTRIVNVSEGDQRCRTGRVFLRDGQEIRLPDLQELKEYTTTASNTRQVANEISSVEIYIPYLNVRHHVTLVDTPGLNGTADGHREQTIELIQKAHACIYLIGRRGLTESDIEFLSYLTRFQKNYIFVQNFIDEVRISEGESVSDKLEEQKQILLDKVFTQAGDCVYSICGVSALMELAAADKKIKRLYATSERDLTLEDRKRLHVQSQYVEFRRLLLDTFREDRLEGLQYGGTAGAIHGWLQGVQERIWVRAGQAIEYYEASRDKRTLDKLQLLRKKMESFRPKQEENLKNFILAQSREIQEKEEGPQLKAEFEKLDGQLAEEIEKRQAIDHLEQYEKSLPSRLDSAIRAIQDASSQRFRDKYQQLDQLLTSRIEAYSGINSPVEAHRFEPSAPPQDSSSFEKPKGRIDQWKEDLMHLSAHASELQKQDVTTSQKLYEAETEVEATADTKAEIEREKARQLSALGSRPAAQKREEAYTDYVYRGGLGFLDGLCGPKEVTRYHTVRDDSRGEAWDQKRIQIQNSFVAENNRLTKELNAQERRRLRLESEHKANQDKITSLEAKINKLKEQIRTEEQKLAQEKQLVAKEYLALCKKNLKQQIQSYLLGEDGICSHVLKNLAVNGENAEIELTHEAMKRFDDAIRQKIQWIEQMEHEKQPEILKQAKILGSTGERLQEMIKQMEEWLK